MTLDQFPKWLQSLLLAFRLDLSANPDRQPTGASLLLATVVSLVGSLVADWLLVKLGTHVFPSTVGLHALSLLRLRRSSRSSVY